MFGSLVKLGGLLFWAWVAYQVGFSVYKRNLHQADWTEYRGDWAIVTGASSGIGRSFALKLAERGINVLALARREELLQSLVKEINDGGAAQARNMVANVLEDGVWDRMAEEAAKLPGPVSILVNNVGGGDSVPQLFKDTSGEEFERNIRLNQDSFVKATHAVLPGMIKRNKGRIISVSSLASYGTPFMMSYSP